MKGTDLALTCENCQHFNNDPKQLEAIFKGMQVFSSGYASVKGGDGLCRRKEVYLTPIKAAGCPQFVPLAGLTNQPENNS